MIWDGKLGRISVAKHSMQVAKIDARSIHCALDQAGPEVGGLERMKTEKMLAMIVVEPAQAECAAPILFATKKYDSLGFL